MLQLALSPAVIWPVAALSTAGILARPFKVAEAWWAVLGAALLLLMGQLTLAEVGHAVGQGTDVYLFLIGMMLVAELARATGLFDWVAALAVRRAKGSSARLFCIVYLVGIVVTTFMSNDATVVVLTPAVLAAARAARLERPLPHLFACALIANAASFVLPVSNPANLVVFAGRMPTLLEWFRLFLLPSAIAIAVTFAALYWNQRADLKQAIDTDTPAPPLTADAKIVAAGIALMGAALLTASFQGVDLGWPTCAVGVAVFAVVAWRARALALCAARDLSWSVLPLVAGLFVLVEALSKIGVAGDLAMLLKQLHAAAPQWSVWAAGTTTALVANVANNLPAGLLAGATMASSQPPANVVAATLIGIDLGPNLSITGSLATVLWLTVLRREGIEVGFFQFLKVGLVAMPVALVLCLLAVLAA
ncbi:arsenic transporter [Massilia sp. WF1]|uniref:SLC13 family permease n=1 Tax=unclassified Massilia TaxID=2609279 RepID=UPI0006498600|nr:MULTISPECIES: SLC13 family permease [unclassified Massilia]ALK97122.1 arsenic transporter [Massilia sp. WG5]KLU36116.1 arsenic transporter [Massilia sp. WF1]